MSLCPDCCVPTVALTCVAAWPCGHRWLPVPAGFALGWVARLGIYRAEQRSAIVRAFLFAPPRPDMRRLRLAPVHAAEDDRSAWTLTPWGPANADGSREAALQRALPLAVSNKILALGYRTDVTESSLL